MSTKHSKSSLRNCLNPPGWYSEHVWEQHAEHCIWLIQIISVNISPCLNRSSVKRCKERCLEEAAQLLRRLPEEQLGVLEESRLLLLVRLLLSLQLQMVNISTACRKVDQVGPKCLCHVRYTPLNTNWNLTESSHLIDRCCNIWQRWTTNWFLEKFITACCP